MEGASRVQRRRVTSRWRRTGCVLQVLRRAVEVLRQAVSTAPETGVETGKHFLSLSVNTNVSTASQRRTNTSAAKPPGVFANSCRVDLPTVVACGSLSKVQNDATRIICPATPFSAGHHHLCHLARTRCRRA